MYRFFPALLVVSTGCGKIQDLRDKVEGLTDGFVVQSLYVGVDNPGHIDLDGAGFDAGARVSTFLADASDISQLENAPITGAPLELLSAGNGGSLVIPPVGQGQYALGAEDGLEYVSGEEVSVVSDYEEGGHRLSVHAPASPELDVDPVHIAGNPMAIDLSGQGFDTALVVVLDMAALEPTYTNEPKGIGELYDLTHPDGKLIGSEEKEEGEETPVVVQIPALAFAREGVYALGVAGIQVSDPDTFEEVNTALSTLMAGRFRFMTVCTQDYAEICTAE